MAEQLKKVVSCREIRRGQFFKYKFINIVFKTFYIVRVKFYWKRNESPCNETEWSAAQFRTKGGK